MDIGMNLNTNVKQINRISKRVAGQIDEMILRNLDELNDKIYEFYTPYAEEIQEVVMQVYSHPYMTTDQFNPYFDRFNELLEPFKQRDDILLGFSEEVIVKNKTMLHEAIDEMFAELAEIGVTYKRAIMERKKMFNTACSRMQRFLNENYHEICGELVAICNFCITSMMDYAESPRLINDEDEMVDVVEIETEVVSNNRLIRTDNVYDIIELAESNGFREERQCGSHKIFKHSNGQILVIPFHGKVINVGLSYGIQKQIYEKIVV